MNKKRILFADDDVEIKEIVSLILSQSYEVEQMSDGREALEKIKENGIDYYDLYLLDIKMPHVDGIEVCMYVKKKKADKPIVMLSSYIEDNQEKFKGFEKIALVLKPFNNSKLISLIDNLIKNG